MKTGLIVLSLLAICLHYAVPAAANGCLSSGCHPALANQVYPHAPVMDDCLGCHVVVKNKAHPQSGQKTITLVAAGAQLCYQCHDTFTGKASIHSPVREGECSACHQVHGAAQPHLLEVGEDLSTLCFSCHDDSDFRAKFRHGPAAAGACTACHDPHMAAERALLKKPARTACLDCHKDFSNQLQAARIVHEPVKKAICADCHNPHAGEARYFLKKKMPELCFSCHPKVADKLAKVKVRHAPINDGGSCGNCHSVHFSNVRGLLSADEKTLCLGCHGKDKIGKSSLKNIALQLAEVKVVKGKTETIAAKNLHGPLEDGSCAGCHDPHGSDNFRMLSGAYPAGFYAPYKEETYTFCLQCHDKNLLRFKETTLYTSFRNGSRNLHVVHVDDPRKGHTCRICHEPHASNGSKLISQKGTPFGDWKIPIRFQTTATGGSCAPGCHQSFSYDRDNPVNYDVKDDLRNKPIQSR